MKRSGRKSMGSAKTSGLRWTRGAAMPTGVWNAGQNVPKWVLVLEGCRSRQEGYATVSCRHCTS